MMCKGNKRFSRSI